MKNKLLFIILILVSVLSACSNDSEKAESNTAQSHSELPSNRIAIPPAVRSNLGITFATVERRNIQDTLRAPGKFEYLPSATREYITMLPGRIELLVKQFDHVNPGTPLYRVYSPLWREIQQTIASNAASIEQLNAKLEMFSPLSLAHEQHEYTVKVNISLWKERVQKLEELRDAGWSESYIESEITNASAKYAEARAELSAIRKQDAELAASYAGVIAELRAAKSNAEFALEAAATMLNISLPQENPKWWKDIREIEIQAAQPGIVQSIDITDGTWVDEHDLILKTVQPDQIQFHAFGLQSDLGALHDGLKARIVPPTPTSSGNAIDLQNTMEGIMQIGLQGDPNNRTIDLYVLPTTIAPWAKAGVTAQLEIVTETTTAPELSIPLPAVQQDGLMPIIFRRAPDNPNEVIRIDADLGINDGRWISVLSGLIDGDEVVLDGGFQLMLATSGSIQKGGHFHADGTFHEGSH